MKFKRFFIYIFFFSFVFNIKGNTENTPSSFADLAEKLMPSVVNISTTQTITTSTNPFPFEDMFKEFGTPQKRKASALGSGFI